MKITKRQLRRIIKESQNLNEYSEHASYADLSDTFEDMLGVLDDVTIKYVDGEWLADQDHASLVRPIEELYDALNMLNNTFNQLASGQPGTKDPSGSPI